MNRMQHAAAIAATTLWALAVGGCSTTEATNPNGSAPTPAGPRIESPAAPLSKLTNMGRHCFGSAADVAAAAARIAADTERQVRSVVDARRIADAGGPLPPVGFDTIFVVSDPDADNCVEVKESRYVPPPAR